MTPRSGRTARGTSRSVLGAGGAFPATFPGGNRIGLEEEEAVLRVIRSKRLFRYYGIVDGPSEVEAFELAFAQALSSRHAVAVGSGTLALMTALGAVGVGPGDQVIVPAYTWVSTAAAVLAVGAVPVIAEVDETLSIDVEDAGRRISDRTRAIIPVHMRGAPADMDSVRELADQHGLAVIEDAAQAIGGSFGGRRLGTIGDIGCFSLQYNKIITCGEGGVVVTNDRLLHDRALMYHDVAASQRQAMGDTPVFFGVVCRMSELQGAVAHVQLQRLDDIIASCRSNRSRIVEVLQGVALRHGIKVRACHDDAGDTSIALILLCVDTNQARSLVDVTRSSGLAPRLLFEPDRQDLHVAYHWAPVVDKRSWSDRGPWSLPAADVSYDPGRWARTTDLLGRAFHLDVSPDLSEDQAVAIGGLLRDAIAGL